MWPLSSWPPPPSLPASRYPPPHLSSVSYSLFSFSYLSIHAHLYFVITTVATGLTMMSAALLVLRGKTVRYNLRTEWRDVLFLERQACMSSVSRQPLKDSSASVIWKLFLNIYQDMDWEKKNPPVLLIILISVSFTRTNTSASTHAHNKTLLSVAVH